MDDSDLKAFDGFDFVIVNVVPMIDAALKLSVCKPMLWWIHEVGDSHSNVYKNVLARYPSCLHDSRIRSIPVYAVSRVAERAFCKYFPDVPVKILPYCVKDEARKYDVENKRSAKNYAPKKQKITFALIAGFSELKQQKLFLEAARRLNESHGGHARFLLVGKSRDDAYSREVIALVEQIPNVELAGLLSRAQMKDLYENEVDVVVCPSLEETMSLAITEGMMHGKVCIASDNIGMAEYITDGKNAFICKAGDEDSLYEKMLYVTDHFCDFGAMRRLARETYEENFTMDAFGEKIDGIIKKIMRRDD